MKRLISSACLFSVLIASTPAYSVIDYCGMLKVKNVRMLHHKQKLKDLKELKSLVTEAHEVRNMLHKKGQLPGEYDGFDQVLQSMQEEVNTIVDEQRSGVTTLTNYSIGAVIFSLIVFKHLKNELKYKSFGNALKGMVSNNKVKASLLLGTAVLFYMGYKKFGKIKENAEKVVELKELIEKLNGLEIQQKEIDYLESIIEEDQVMMDYYIGLWKKDKKIEEVSLDSDGLLSCY